MAKKGYDFVAIGDLVTDAFIKLSDAKVTCDVNSDNCMISMRFGDKIPYEKVDVIPAVGNSANTAVSAARLGLKTALVSNIGDDRDGEDALNVFKKEKVGTDFVKVNKGMKTNYHYVLSYEGERTILIKHEDYKYKMPNIGSPKWIYLSSAGHNSIPFHKEVVKYLQKHKDIKLAFQPGTFQMKAGTKKLASIYKLAEVVFMNKEESQRVLKTKETNIKKLLDKLCALGPKIAVITDGRDGAYVKQGKEYWFMPIYPDPRPPLERTGAGDAFSSTFTIALAQGKSIEEALMWGPINSMSVVQAVGAQAGLLNKSQLQKLLKSAPKSYQPKRI